MADFSASDAATTGFRIVRERPVAVLYWGALRLVLDVSVALLLVTLAGPAMTALQNAGASAQTDPAQSIKFFEQLAPAWLAMTPLQLIFYAIVCGAMNRAVLRPDEDRLGYLRLGADELRQVAVLFLYSLVMVAIYMVTVLVVAILAGVLSVGLAAAAGGAGAALGFIIAFLAILAAVGFMLFVGVRLSLAPALTFDTGKVNLFGSWALTQGRFWPILGAYFLSWILVLLMLLLSLVIIAGAAAAVSGGLAGVSAMFKPDMSTVATYFTPVRIVMLVMSSFFSALFLPVSLTPPAFIYKSLTASRNTRAVEGVFA